MASLQSHFRPVGAMGVTLFRSVGWRVGGILLLTVGQLQAALTLTNLAQLHQQLRRERQVTAKVQLVGTVFAADTNTGAVLWQDASGLGLLEVDGWTETLQPGDQVEISSDSARVAVGELGIQLTPSPLINNDGVHGVETVVGRCWLPAGRHPVRVDWFNQMRRAELSLSVVATNLPGAVATGPPLAADRFHDIKASYYHGNWMRLPNFQMLQPVRTETLAGFNLDRRTRAEMVGIRFEAWFEAPQDGEYVFSLSSDDGSCLWIGPSQVSVRKRSAGSPPVARLTQLGEPMARLDNRSPVMIEGRVRFVSRAGKGLRLELRSDEQTISVALANAGELNDLDLLNARVRVVGMAGAVRRSDQELVLGSLTTVGAGELTVLEPPPGRRAMPEVLTSAMQIHSLSSDAAAREVPATLEGVVTAVGQAFDRWMVIQDETRGVFVRLERVAVIPEVGQRWEVSGRTQPGDFAPVIVAEQVRLRGRGRLPAPARPSLSQLSNGSMDVQWVELQGVVTAVQENQFSLLLADGRLEVMTPVGGEIDWKQFADALVRIRGVLFSVWNPDTHEVRIGIVALHNALVSVDRPAPVDVFDAPEKTPRGLFRFDAKATPLQRVKVRGQVTYVYGGRVFLEQASGIEVLTKLEAALSPGDLVEAVGYPSVSEVGPQLREAQVRKTGTAPLPEAPLLVEPDVPDAQRTFSRRRIQGKLLGMHSEADQLVLQIQADQHFYLAYVADAAVLEGLRLGSKLALTGVYVSIAPGRRAAGETQYFQLHVHSARDVTVLSRPSWWTLPRLLAALGGLVVVLTLSAVWIVMLRRRVAQRTLQLQAEIRERERFERQHELEAERSRIARDLHDDLGSRLTEINFLASASGWAESETDRVTTLEAISARARDLVKALDVIVWAVDPEADSLQALADYLSSYTREYLASSPLLCRFRIPMSFPNRTVDGRVRHEVLMVLKEVLNNIVRHAQATEVRFQMDINAALEICITDNGRGFDAAVERGGHGLKNCPTRLERIGGTWELQSTPGQGTTVRMRIPLAGVATN